MSEGESGVLVIADDLSGAAEVAATLDGRVPIVLSPAAGLSETDDAHQHDLVVDLDCRYLPSEEARARTAEAISALSAHDDAITLVKVDSLLRGNIRDALSATLESTSGPVIFAPALPQQNRTIVDGAPFDNGVRLSQTRAWELEHGPAPETLQELCPASARHLSLTEVRTSELLRTVIDDVRTQHLFTADAETMEDLDRLVALAEATSAVLVGTAALARAIAVRRTALRGRGRADRAERTGVVPTAHPPAGRVLTLLGTAADRIDAQISHLLARTNNRVVDLPAVEVASWAGDRQRMLSTAADLRDLLKESDLVVRLTDTGPAVDPRQLPALLAELTAHALDGSGPVALAAAGGETARAVLDRLGVRRLETVDEIHPGAVLSTVAAASADASDTIELTTVVTRPGGHGGPDSLTLIHAALTAYEHNTITAATVANHEGESMNALPTVAVTMGDGAGVGPEICIAACLDPSVLAVAEPVVIGDAVRLEKAAEVLGTTVEIRRIEEPGQAEQGAGVINVIDLALLPRDLPWGELSSVAGDAAFRYIERAADLALSGHVQAICTAPLNKEALHAAGHRFPGHTEMLASLTGTEEVSMMLSSPKLRVIHVTTHIGLIDAVAKIEPGLVERTVRRGHDALVRAGLEQPHIGVCAINPHAGENGLFGYGEEAEKITPAITRLQAAGIDAVGPLPADTAFFLAGRGDYDLIVAMYHDQGHGPIKVLGIDAGVNITVGLPVIRTSVDHGTAFDIAGTGKVDTESMSEAMRQAAALAVV
jgi:4-hydroxythreonine-4-phosphate dehydrogenase